MQKNASREQALKNAYASARMEGFTVTPDNERDCRRLLNGEISVEQLVAEIKRKNIDREHPR